MPAGPRGDRALGGFPPRTPAGPLHTPRTGLSPTCTPRAVIPRLGSAARSRLVLSGLPSAALPGPRLPTPDLFPGAGRAGGRSGRNCCPRAAGRARRLPARPPAAARFALSQRGRRRGPRAGAGARTRPEGEARALGEG